MACETLTLLMRLPQQRIPGNEIPVHDGSQDEANEEWTSLMASVGLLVAVQTGQ